MHRTALIIQARMGSSRLPGKSMMELHGEPLVGRILERVKRCQKIDEIVLAIPDNESNLILRDLGENYGVKVFLGSESNVLERYFNAAKEFAADYVVRLPADNPVPEAIEIDKIINYHINLKRKGFSSNLAEINNSGYPDGIGAEVFDFSILKDAIKKCPGPEKREHVHLNFYNYLTKKAVDINWCPINTLKCPKAYRRPDLILDVNTIEQFKFMQKLYDYLYPRNPEFTIIDIIKWHDNIYLLEK